MIDGLLTAVAAFLLANVLVGLVRALRGPTTRDRLLPLVFLGTTGAAMLAVLAEVMRVPALRDAALVLVALAVLVVVVRVHGEEGDH